MHLECLCCPLIYTKFQSQKILKQWWVNVQQKGASIWQDLSFGKISQVAADKEEDSQKQEEATSVYWDAALVLFCPLLTLEERKLHYRRETCCNTWHTI